MNKKLITIVLATILSITFLFQNATVQAETTYNGTFVSFGYDETKPVSVVVIDGNGRQVRHAISANALYYMNGNVTNASSFKNGLTVQMKKDGNDVIEIRGVTNVDTESASATKYQMNGVVTKIDPNGMFVQVKTEFEGEKQFYINTNTKFVKNNTVVDLTMLYEGDKVKVKVPNQQTSTLVELEIMATGVMVENIYKATLKSADAYRNTITVENAQAFENWMFGSNVSTKLSTVNLGTSATLFAGNTSIKKENLNQYVGKEVYFVTVTQFSREVIQRIVVLQDNERTYYDNLKSINTAYNYIQLNSAGNLYYHDGSILIRNGRLIEPTSLTSFGTAFVVTDGINRGNFAHVVNVTNDGFNAPNLSNYDLYFGELSYVDQGQYLLEIDDAVKLTNHYWKSTTDSVFSFSNGTYAVANTASSKIKLIPNMDLMDYETLYGYFYVKNGHVQALQLLQPSQTKTSGVLTGTIANITSNEPAFMSLKNVSQWINGGWVEAGAIENLNLNQTLILKNGKAIDGSQLRTSDRVVALINAQLEVQVILVNE